uniref:hypothetical protein n=1 Tax=Methylobacterium segetis TaxID=2488750 RepID=UPI00140477A9
QEASTRASQDSAQASLINDVSAVTNAGTAQGRFSLFARSGVSGVSVRLEAYATVNRGGQIRGAGWYIDLLDNGSSRFVIDANLFAITANGGLTYPFQFDGQTLTIPNLVVTTSLIAPNGSSDRVVRSGGVGDARPSSPGFREIPGCSYDFYADGDWSVLIASTADVYVEANGTANVQQSSALTVAIAIDGVPLNSGRGQQSYSVTAGGNTTKATYQTGPIDYTAMRVIGTGNHRISLMFKWEGGANSGATVSANMYVVVLKR